MATPVRINGSMPRSSSMNWNGVICKKSSEIQISTEKLLEPVLQPQLYLLRLHVFSAASTYYDARNRCSKKYVLVSHFARPRDTSREMPIKRMPYTRASCIRLTLVRHSGISV
jgi:hypothetical protein